MKNLTFLFFLIQAIVFSYAQKPPEFKVNNYNKNVGPYGYMNIVMNGLQDKNGNLWFATNSRGIFRYDGKIFKNFTEKDGLFSNFCNTIYEDRGGNIWVSTKYGIGYYDGNVFKEVPIFSKAVNDINFGLIKTEKKDSNVGVHRMYQDKNGSMWFAAWGFGNEAGVYKYDGKNVFHYLNGKAIQTIVEDNSGNIWFDSNRLDISSPLKQLEFTDFGGKNGFTKEMMFFAKKDKTGNLWFAPRGNGLYRFDGKNFSFFSEKEGLLSNRVSCIHEDKAGKLWLGSDVKNGTDRGDLYIYDGKTFTNFTEKEGTIFNVRCIVEDNMGNLWFGTRGKGLWKYDGKTLTDFSEEIFSDK